MILHHNLIGGRWVPARSGRTLPNVDPADTRDVLGTLPASDGGDVQDAIAAAQAAFPAWRSTPAPRRADVLFRAVRIFERRRDELARALTREEGKILRESQGEVQKTINVLEFMAGEGRRMGGLTRQSELPNTFCYTRRDPLGVVGLVTPWNFPIAVPTWKIGPALVAGNTVVFKPSELTPWTSQLICEIFEEAGLPPGVLNLVHGTGPDAGQPLVDHPAIRAVSFTGSNPVGTAIARSCAARGAAAQCEMGGKNPIIVLADADLDLAAEGAAQGAFGSTGQRCTATSRAVVHASVADAFVEKVAAKLRAIRVGNGMDPASTIGPAVEEKQHRKVLSYVGIGREDGATLVAGGRDLRTEAGLEHGWFLEPALFDHVTPSMRIAQEEIFGPVLAVLRVATVEEAFEVSNGVRYGLSSSIYTQDVARVFEYADRIETGILHVNSPTMGGEAHLPFGGVKDTGIGGREMNEEAIAFFSELKAVYVDYTGRRRDTNIY
ncbi:MAG: aldehyde dehydrogenase [Myxococcales bacterium]